MRLAVVVDICNLYHCAQQTHNRKVNYREVYSFCEEWGTITHAAAYGASLGDQSAKFVGALHKIGFETHFKVPKTIKKAKTLKHKADWDVGMAIDTLKILDDFDTLVLCTADGDLAPLITRVKEFDKQVWVMGTGISHELTALADETFEIIDRFLERR